ncbi:hypothetical protein ABLE93_20390 [Xanthobacter sp. KR7-65]|uniref:hypothetical protein n=1 Tax=Xanthobacter sp. KR7-65 TaxID=3156612 RepID=UPI0032B45010
MPVAQTSQTDHLDDRIKDRFSEWLRDLARHMARSGRYCSWRLIQIELRFMQGIREAASCFSDAAIRSELDALCREAQKRAGAALVLPAIAESARAPLQAGR